MIKELKFSNDSRIGLFNGLEKIYNAVSISLGPEGKLAAIDRGYSTEITKDGVTIARSIDLEDKFENMGAQLIKEAAIKSGDVGDGTTTTVILAYAMAKEGLKALATGYSAAAIKKGMEAAVNTICEYLEDKATPISSSEDIYNIAKVSSNGDEKIAELVKEAFEKVGNDALIKVEESSTSETSLDIKQGLTIPDGYISPYFINNEKMESDLKDPLVLVTDQTISTVSQIVNILNAVAKTGRPLFIIAEDITGEALPVLITNHLKQSIRINAVKAPSYGGNKKECLQDIATATGAVFVSQDFGIQVADVGLEMLGSAEKIVSTQDTTTIISGKGNPEEIKKRINSIKVLIENETNSRIKEKLQERLSKLSGGVCVLNVASATAAQGKEVRDRIDDTICAVRASIKKGVVTGGGITLLLAKKEDALWEGDYAVGANIVYKALEYPLRKLAENADMSPDVIVNETLEKSNGKSGYDISKKEWDDELYKKVVDPVLVEISALRNALSVATLLLNTEVAIAEKNKEE